MKTTIILLSVITFLLVPNCLAQLPTTIYTPKGNSFTAWNNMPYMSDHYKDSIRALVAENFPQATEVSSPTYDYNCHGYALHMIEGGNPVWIGLEDYDQNSETVYKVYLTDESYIETTEANATYIEYYSGPHSAVKSPTPGKYRSKWSYWGLYDHAPGYGPENYYMNDRKYYKLNFGINSPSSALCGDDEMTFSSNVSISGSTYNWYKYTNLTYVSGAGTPNYRIKRNTGATGETWVNLEMTTPSGAFESIRKYFWLGSPETPTITDIYGDPPDYLEVYDYKPYMIWTYPGADPGTADWWAYGPVDIDPYGQYCYVQAYQTGYAMLYVTTYNDCDMSPEGSAEIQIVSGKRSGEEDIIWTISPNPAKSYIDLTITEKENSDKLLDKYTVEFIDAYSRIVKVISLSGPENRINIQELSVGHYFVRLTYNDKIYGKTLIVQ